MTPSSKRCLSRTMKVLKKKVAANIVIMAENCMRIYVYEMYEYILKLIYVSLVIYS